MSDELTDEVEALNSIYGDGTLLTAEGSPDSAATYILQLPGDEASSLKLFFPPTYPDTSSPEVLATHHASGGRKGAGARDLRLFREAVEEAYMPGMVCLFDAVEEFTRRLEVEIENERIAAAKETENDATNGGGGGGVRKEQEDRKKKKQEEEEILATMKPPPWTQSELLVDMKSTFLAHVAPVTSPQQASLFIAHLLASDKRIRDATHNITAWRIRDHSASNGEPSSTTTVYQDSDDDGETAAGARVLHLMQVMDIWDAVVVVTRWYGGVKLGPRRFAVINAVAREGFVRAGMVVEKGGEKEKKKRG